MRRAPAAALFVSLLLPVVGSAEPDMSRERENYLLHCSGCHGAEGRGVPGTTPSLHELGLLLSEQGGRDYLARVPGVAQASLGDAELAKLLNWVLAEFSQARLDPPYAADELGKLRADPIRDTVAARERLLAGSGAAARELR
jgi:mono/diheme cytochrome c family protein